MNPERMRELLTAAVDGELTSSEQRLVERLLKESEAARILHAQLQQDAALLKSLPRVQAPADFAQRVLQEIQGRGLTPTPLPPTPRITRPQTRQVPTPWTSIIAATAAVLMVLVSSAALYYIASSNTQQIAQNKAKDEQPSRPSRPIPSNALVLDKPTRLDIQPREIVPQVVAVTPKAVSEMGPEPRTVEERFLFNQPHDVPEIQAFQLEKIRVSHFYALGELAEKETQKRLIDDLKKDELLRLDLFCNSTAKGLEIIQGAFKAHKVTIGVDAHATDRLAKKLPTELVLYTESLTPEEVAGLLTVIGIAESKRSGAGEFDTLVVAPFLASDLTQLGRLLGASAVMPKITTNKGVDIRKPLPDGTAQQVASSLSKMGTGKPAAKVEKPAIVVSYSPMNLAPNNSKEIKTFLEQRGERKPNTKPLMLVLRTR